MGELKDRAREARQLAGEKTVPPWAKKLGVSSAAIYLIESGKTFDLKAATAEGMARLSGLRAEWIRTGRGPKMATDGLHLVEPPERAQEPGFKEAQQDNSLHSIRVALLALFGEMASSRPAEAERVAEVLRASVKSNFRDQGLLSVLLTTLDRGVQERKRARKRARPRG